MSEILALQEMSGEQASLDVIWESAVSVDCEHVPCSTYSWGC